MDLLPARTGAAASYLYLVTVRLGLPAEAAIASFTLSLVLDTLALAPLLLIATWLVVGAAPLSRPLLLVGGSLVLLAGSLGVALGPAAAGLRLAARVAGRFPGWIGRAAWGRSGRGRRRGPAARRAGEPVPALGLSLALRLTKYAAYYCLLQAILTGAGLAAGWLDLPPRVPQRGRGRAGGVAALADDRQPRALRGRRGRSASRTGWGCPATWRPWRSPPSTPSRRSTTTASGSGRGSGSWWCARRLPGKLRSAGRAGFETRRDPCRRDGATDGLHRRPSPRRAGAGGRRAGVPQAAPLRSLDQEPGGSGREPPGPGGPAVLRGLERRWRDPPGLHRVGPRVLGELRGERGARRAFRRQPSDEAGAPHSVGARYGSGPCWS